MSDIKKELDHKSLVMWCNKNPAAAAKEIERLRGELKFIGRKNKKEENNNV